MNKTGSVHPYAFASVFRPGTFIHRPFDHYQGMLADCMVKAPLPGKKYSSVTFRPYSEFQRICEPVVCPTGVRLFLTEDHIDDETCIGFVAVTPGSNYCFGIPVHVEKGKVSEYMLYREAVADEYMLLETYAKAKWLFKLPRIFYFPTTDGEKLEWTFTDPA